MVENSYINYGSLRNVKKKKTKTKKPKPNPKKLNRKPRIKKK